MAKKKSANLEASAGVQTTAKYTKKKDNKRNLYILESTVENINPNDLRDFPDNFNYFPDNMKGLSDEKKAVLQDLLDDYAKDAQEFDVDELERCKDSVDDYGVWTPLIIARDNTILAGHRRKLLAIANNLATVPCLRMRNELSMEEMTYFVIEENLKRRHIKETVRKDLWNKKVGVSEKASFVLNVLAEEHGSGKKAYEYITWQKMKEVLDGADLKNIAESSYKRYAREIKAHLESKHPDLVKEKNKPLYHKKYDDFIASRQGSAYTSPKQEEMFKKLQRALKEYKGKVDAYESSVEKAKTAFDKAIETARTNKKTAETTAKTTLDTFKTQVDNWYTELKSGTKVWK